MSFMTARTFLISKPCLRKAGEELLACQDKCANEHCPLSHSGCCRQQPRAICPHAVPSHQHSCTPSTSQPLQSIVPAEVLVSLHLDVTQDLENSQAVHVHEHDPLRASCSQVMQDSRQARFICTFSGSEAMTPETGERSLILTRTISIPLSRTPLNPLRGEWSGFADHSRQPVENSNAVGAPDK